MPSLKVKYKIKQNQGSLRLFSCRIAREKQKEKQNENENEFSAEAKYQCLVYIPRQSCLSFAREVARLYSTSCLWKAGHDPQQISIGNPPNTHAPAAERPSVSIFKRSKSGNIYVLEASEDST
jgi:hypothetical protein